MKYREIADKEPLDVPDLYVDDEVSLGRFKNRKAKVTGMGRNKRNQPTIKTTKGEKNLFTFDIDKLKEE